jgi:hypothetical protein
MNLTLLPIYKENVKYKHIKNRTISVEFAVREMCLGYIETIFTHVKNNVENYLFIILILDQKLKIIISNYVSGLKTLGLQYILTVIPTLLKTMIKQPVKLIHADCVVLRRIK